MKTLLIHNNELYVNLDNLIKALEYGANSQLLAEALKNKKEDFVSNAKKQEYEESFEDLINKD